MKQFQNEDDKAFIRQPGKNGGPQDGETAALPKYIRLDKNGYPRIGGFLYVIAAMLILRLFSVFAPSPLIPWAWKIILFAIYLVCAVLFFTRRRKFKIFFIILLLAEVIPGLAIFFNALTSIEGFYDPVQAYTTTFVILGATGLMMLYIAKSKRVGFTFIH